MKLTSRDYLSGGLRYFYSVRTIIYTIVLTLVQFWVFSGYTKYALLFAIIFSLGWTLLRLWPYLKAGVKELKSNPAFTEETHWETDDENFIRSSQNTAVKRPLQDIGKIEESPTWLYVQMKDGKFIMIAKKQAGEDFVRSLSALKGKIAWEKLLY